MGADPRAPDPTAPPSAGRDSLAHEANTELELQVPALRRLLRLLGRAITLRCPNCGGGPVLEHWFRMRQRCGRCKLSIERGESDYFIGAMMFNLVLAEGLFAVLFVGFLMIRWPLVPWDTIQIVAPLGMVAAPVLLYPISKLMWLAFDLAFRPNGPGDPHDRRN
ncbi:MAG: DUF983 domain-containing protein [Gemmatimonadaceae bacterium]